MTRLWADAPSLQVEVNIAGRPVRFRWQGRAHAILRIEQAWQVDTDWWVSEGRVQRDYYAVTTRDGLLCVLYHDRLAGGWFLSRLYD